MAGRDERSYTWILMGGAVLALLIVSGLLLLLKNGASTPNAPNVPAQQNSKKNKDVSSNARPIRGGSYESSGVVAVPGSDQVLVVDDKNPSNVLAITLNGDSEQVGDVVMVPLGVDVEDLEDITSDGQFYYVVGSQFRKGSSKGSGLVRFTYDAASHTARDISTVDGLKELLLTSVADLASARDEKRTEGAINIEGLAWDAKGNRLLLGLRNPLSGDDAMVVPVSLKNPTGSFHADNVTLGAAIKVSLGGQAIRSIEYDPTGGRFLLIGGAPEGEKNMGFTLWSWDGSATPQKLRDLDASIKPEGLAILENGGQRSLLIVGDAGYLMRLPLP